MSIAQRAPSSLDQQFIGFQIIRSNCEQLIAMLSHIDRDSMISQDVDPGNQ